MIPCNVRAATAVATLCALMLSGCGGGVTDSGEPVYTIEEKWVDQDGQPIAGATVALQLDRLYSTTTRPDGRYVLEIPQNYAYPSYFAGYITKTGYLPTTIFFSKTGATPNFRVSQRTRQTTDADVVFDSGIRVTHLGDDSFTGSANSQLQLPSSGLFWAESFTLSPAQAAKYGTLCVTFQARGVQSFTSRDYVSVSANGAPGTFDAQLMANSPDAGNYAGYRHCFSLARFRAGDTVTVSITSGNNDGKRDDRDDFEITNVLGLLEP